MPGYVGRRRRAKFPKGFDLGALQRAASEARAMRRERMCEFYGDGCCGDPDEHDYCGQCPLASAEHPDRNGGYPGA